MTRRDEPRYWAGVLGHNVARRRVNLGWSQSVLAAKVTNAGWRLNVKQVSALENGGRYRGTVETYLPVTVDRMMILAQVLCTTHLTLLTEH